MVPVKLLNVSTRLEVAVQERSNTPSIIVGVDWESDPESAFEALSARK
jgi:hypothetical protein